MTVPPPEPPAEGEGARRGRLGNRLTGEVSGYARLVDLDPRVSPEVLDALELAGIAAYVEPVTGHTGAWMEVRLPDRPTDRLHVDARRLDDARSLLRGRHLGLEAPAGGDATSSDAGSARGSAPGSAPGSVPGGAPGGPPGPGGAPDEEAAWRAIVAGFGSSPDAPVPPWPVSEDVDPSGGDGDEERRPLLRRRADRPDSGADGEDGADEDAPVRAEDEGHYVPPPPPPLPRPARRTALCWAAIVLGGLLLLAPGLLLVPRTNETGAVGAVLVLGGIAALVWGMRDGLPVDEGPDDGAVV